MGPLRNSEVRCTQTTARMNRISLDLIPQLRGETFMTTPEGDGQTCRLSTKEKFIKKSVDAESWVVCLENRTMFLFACDNDYGWERIENLTPIRLKDDKEGLIAWRTNLRIDIEAAHRDAWSSEIDAWSSEIDARSSETAIPTAAPFNTWHDTCRDAHLYGGVNYQNDYETGMPSSPPGVPRLSSGYHSE